MITLGTAAPAYGMKDKMSVIAAAIEAMGYFGMRTAPEAVPRLSTEEVFKRLGVFSVLHLRFLKELDLPDETLEGIKYEAAKAVLEMAESLGEKKSQIRWGENVNKIYSAVALKYPDIFEEVEHRIKLHNLAGRYRQEIEFLRGKINRHCGAATVISQDRADKFISEYSKACDELAEKIAADSQLEHLTGELLAELKSAREDGVSFIKAKLSEEPVRLLYYKTGDRVAVKVQLNRNGWSYSTGRGREVRHNRGVDRQEWPLILSVDYIMDFLCANKVEDPDVLVEEKSVNQFYLFRVENRTFVSEKLTDSFVETWWDYNCPDLVRGEPNKHEDVNMLDMKLCHFTTTLVERSYLGDYIGDSITEEEVARLTKDRQHTRLYRSMKAKLDAKKLAHDEARVKELREKVESFERKVQECINSHSQEVLKAIVTAYPSRVTLKKSYNQKLIDDLGITDDLLEEVLGTVVGDQRDVTMAEIIEVYRQISLATGESPGFEQIVNGIFDSLPEITFEDVKINDNLGLDCGFLFVQAEDREYTEAKELLSNIEPGTRYMKIHMPYWTQSTTLQWLQFRVVRELVEKDLGIVLNGHTQLD